KSEEAAKQFAKEAPLWLRGIETGSLITATNGVLGNAKRRIVMNRCYGNPVPRLVAGWARAMWQAGTRLITVLGTPSAAGVVALRALGPTWRVPFHRSPYYLTVRPLGDATPPAFFDFQRWDCLGGDIL
ncbi:MAG TPA: hypothetical protein PLZ56_15390, partial [Anaerolineae bacterium]|nr:hypothetical protein [Anaerolineae bacterium]